MVEALEGAGRKRRDVEWATRILLVDEAREPQFVEIALGDYRAPGVAGLRASERGERGCDNRAAPCGASSWTEGARSHTIYRLSRRAPAVAAERAPVAREELGSVPLLAVFGILDPNRGSVGSSSPRNTSAKTSQHLP
jgi:hypothetical protein